MPNCVDRSFQTCNDRRMPWEKQYDETKVLDRAMETFWSRGYEATSINDLVAATGINRGSLYAAFTDKRTLFLRALERYDLQYREDFLSTLAAEHDPRSAIVEAFRAVIAGARSGRARRGCLLVNTSMELSPHDPEIDKLIRVRLAKVERFFRSMVEAAQRDGTVNRRLDADNTGKRLFGLFIALRVLARSRPERSVMDAIRRQAEDLLG